MKGKERNGRRKEGKKESKNKQTERTTRVMRVCKTSGFSKQILSRSVQYFIVRSERFHPKEEERVLSVYGCV